MKKQLFLFLCTLFSIVAGVQKVQAYTVENLVEDGWTLVNSESVTGVDDNVYVLVDAYSSAYVMSAEADHFRPCYKTIDSPLGHPSFVWNLEGSDNSFALKSVATGAYFKQADGWNTSVGYSRDNRNKATCTFTLNGGKYDLKCNESNAMVGHWNDGTSGVANDGENIAANKGTAAADGFYLYAKSKADYIAALAAARKEAAAGASKESPVEVTSWIQNADFSGDWGGWECTFSSSGNMQWGQKTLESWNAGNVLIKQTLSGVPDGLYRLTADVISGNNDNKTAYVFATGAGESKSSTVSAVASAGNYNTMSAEVAGKTLTADNCLVTNGVLTVGINQPSGWIVADNFKLYYMGEDMSIYVEAYNSAKAAAEAIDQSAPMNAGALAALQQALADYATVDETSKSALQDATSALSGATAAATASINAYAAGKASLDKVDAILANTNVYTAEAYTTFGEAKLAAQNGYDNRTWTNEEAQAYGSTVFGTGWRTNATIDDFLISAWDAAPRDWSTYHINTWSTTGDSGNPNLVTPCFEYWTGDNTTLANKTITATLGGFAPGATYKVAMTVCAGVNTGVAASTTPTGATLQLNDGEAVDVCAGDRIAETRFYEGTFEANATIGADGNLVIKLNVYGTNASWITWRDVKYTKTADPSDPTPYREAVAAKLTVAQGLVNEVMNANVETNLNNAIAATAGYEENFDIAALEQMAADLDDANAAAQTSVANYEEAAAIINAASTLDEAGQAVYNSNNKVLEVKAGYDNKTLVAVTDEQKTLCQAALKTAVKAQTTDGADWTLLIDNPGFEGSYTSVANPSANRDIYQPEGWTAVWENGNENDMTSLNSSCTQWNNFAEMPQPTDGGNNVYWARYRWGNQSSLTLKQTIPGLPAGVYELGAEGYLSNATNGKATLSVKFGDEVAIVDFTAAAWTTKNVAFAINEEQDVEILYNLTENAQVEIKAGVDNFTLTARSAASTEDYAALNAAIETAEGYTLGFEKDEFAPYNNTEALKALADAKAINQSVVNTKGVVQAATAALTYATWTANAEQLNAVWDGSFEYDYRATTPSGNVNPYGWQRVKDAAADGYNVRYMDGSNAGLAATSSHKALFTKQSAYYGYADGYTMPLKANTLYKLTFVYGGWGDCKMDGYVSMTDPDGNAITLSVTDLPLDATDADANPESWKTYTAYFTTGEAGNYVLGLRKKDYDTSGQSQYVYGDIVLKKAQTYAITVADTENGTVVADKAEAAEGETVTLTATPAANYQFAGAYYMLNEEKVDITIDGNTASFAMPAAAVNVIATFEQKTDFTDRIVNANLTGTDPKGFDDAGTKGIDGSGIVKAGNNAQFDFKQTISLPAGQYKLTAQAAYRFGGSEADEAAAIVNGETTKFASLYATIGEKTVSTLVQNRYDGASETDYAAGSGSVVVNEKYVPNSSSAVQAWFNAGQYVNELVFNLTADGDVTIGIAKDAQPAAGDYTVIGPWTLTRLGDPVTMYAITVGETVNGSVSVDKTEAASGETVTVTVTPDAGYELDFLGYSRGMTGVMIPVENNVGTFTMPAGDVTVNASFKEVEDLSYKFVPSEWIAGDAGRIAPANVVADDETGTITVDKTGANNVALVFRSAKTYEVKAEQRYFVIKATGLSTDEAASYLWWLNNTNNGSQIKPTSIYEEEGKTVFAWDCVTIPIGDKLGIEDTEFTDQGGWSTTFGMTLADDAVPAVISYIGFQESIPEPVEEFAYEFVPSEWVAGDAGRISPENVTADDDMGTITVNKTGDNNVALLFKTSKTYYVENIEYFYIKAKGISTEEGKSYLWWLNGKNDGGKQFAPTHIKTEADGTIILEWRIDKCGNIGENISATGKSYLAGGDGWNTTFGLTQADDTVPVVITDIGYSNDSPTGISLIESESAEGALKDGKYLIKGKIVIVKNGKQYNAAGQLK